MKGRAIALLAAVLLLAGIPKTGPVLAGVGGAQWSSQTADRELAFSAWYEGEELVGHFTKFSVRIELDEAGGDPRLLTVEVDLGSADMNDREVNEELAEPEWFDSRSYPLAVFTSREIRRAGSGYLANGTLRLKNTEQSVEIPLDWKRDGNSATVSGAVVLSRRAWQVGSGEWASETSLADRVELRYRVALSPEP